MSDKRLQDFMVNEPPKRKGYVVVIFGARTMAEIKEQGRPTLMAWVEKPQMFFFDEQADWEWAIRGLYRNNPHRGDVWTAQVSEPTRTIKGGTRLRIALDTETIFCPLD